MWEWHAFDARTSELVATTPMVTWDHTAELNGAGNWNATLAPPPDRQHVDAVRAGTLPGRTVIVAMRDGRIVGDGFVTLRDVPDLAGAGLLAYFDRHLLDLDNDLVFAGADQHAIATYLIGLAASVPGGSINIDTSTVGMAGVARDQTWTPSEAKNIGEAIRQKAAIIGGYDFDLRCELDGGQVVRRLRCWTPRRGRTWQDPDGVTFTLGRNAWEVPAIDEDGVMMTTRVIALGEEIDATTKTRRRVIRTSTKLLDAGYPVLDYRLDLSDVKDDATLTAHADGHLAKFGQPDGGKFTLRVDPDEWASWDIGDDCMVVIPPWQRVGAATFLRDDWIRPHEWLPDGRSALGRIVARQWKVDGQGESLFVTVGPPL